ncbi:VacJ family lipoprotein [Tropicimonas sp.]|uniref:MlaA family lipoprotein n=1 Tax=Tropicimonas sp. TaxID=2067044 RepID=UPI003A84F027
MLSIVTALSACGPASIPTGINDPNEAQNRRIHEWNKSLDRHVFGGGETAATGRNGESPAPSGAEDGLSEEPDEAAAPAAAGDAPVRPVSPIIVALANFGNNLNNPSRILNSLLQLRPGDAAHNTLRFGINSTVGLGGIFDPATAAGLPEIDTNFSETMHVWGVPEGAYMELPVFGGSTQRDTAGSIVDLAINPLWYAVEWPASLAANGFVWVGQGTDRVRYADTVSSIYEDSEDSYSQQRLIYLQNRRFELRRGEVAEEDYEDPYEDIYGN